MENINNIRRQLEKKYSHVTFVKSLSDKTVWTIGENATTKTIKKDDVKMATTIVKTLSNGVKVHELDVKNDFSQAQKMLDCNDVTENIDAYCAYNIRQVNNLEGTYEIVINRFDDYNRFKDMMEKEKCYSKGIEELKQEYYRNRITYDIYQEKANKLNECKCSKCAVKTPTMDEWKTGMIQEKTYVNNEHFVGYKTKEIKINKALTKSGYSKEIIDFYSQQIKVERTIFLTIASKVQFITGMSHLALIGSFDGYMGTSCQDPRHGYDECHKLAGALHDDGLFIGMMHYNLDDVYNMQDKLVARCLFRLVEVEGVELMIPTDYYGNLGTKDMMHNALLQLEEIGIYSNDIHEGNYDELETISVDANGGYNMNRIEDVYIYEDIDVNIDVDCPLCNGNGDYTVYDSNDNSHDVTCPMCSGDGTYTVNVYETIDTTIEVENEDADILPYDGEGFYHRGSHVKTRVNISKIIEDNQKYNR